MADDARCLARCQRADRTVAHATQYARLFGDVVTARAIFFWNSSPRRAAKRSISRRHDDLALLNRAHARKNAIVRAVRAEKMSSRRSLRRKIFSHEQKFW